MIKQVTAKQVLPIRHQVMWPNKPESFCQVAGDEKALHFGYFQDEKLVSVISVFITGQQAQFRKFATLVDFQGQGIGSVLLTYVFDYLDDLNIKNVWCNARRNKTSFYERFGMVQTDQTFEKAGQSYIIMQKEV